LNPWVSVSPGQPAAGIVGAGHPHTFAILPHIGSGHPNTSQLSMSPSTRLPFVVSTLPVSPAPAVIAPAAAGRPAHAVPSGPPAVREPPEDARGARGTERVRPTDKPVFERRRIPGAILGGGKARNPIVTKVAEALVREALWRRAVLNPSISLRTVLHRKDTPLTINSVSVSQRPPPALSRCKAVAVGRLVRVVCLPVAASVLVMLPVPLPSAVVFRILWTIPIMIVRFRAYGLALLPFRIRSVRVVRGEPLKLLDACRSSSYMPSRARL